VASVAIDLDYRTGGRVSLPTAYLHGSPETNDIINFNISMDASLQVEHTVGPGEQPADNPAFRSTFRLYRLRTGQVTYGSGFADDLVPPA
jgi:hypothetical protein